MVVAPPAETAVTTIEIPQYPILRLTVEQYQQMIDTGILTEDNAVELLEGWLVKKMSKNPPHSYSTQEARDLFFRLLPEGWFVSDQEPITTLDSVPEPDLIIARGKRKDFITRRLQPADVALVGEVSDSTLHQDRTLKLRIYAKAGIPVYWILNLPDSILEVYTDPTGDTYQQRRVYHPADSVPVLLDGQEVGQIAVGELFG